MIELIRLGTTNHVTTSHMMNSNGMCARLALTSGYQSLLRRMMDERLSIGLNVQGGRNIASVSLLEQNDACLILIRDMIGVKLFHFDETTLTVLSVLSD